MEKWVISNTQISRPGPVWRAIKKFYKEKFSDTDLEKVKLKNMAHFISQHYWGEFTNWIKETYK